jgi:hypothetical protein
MTMTRAWIWIGIAALVCVGGVATADEKPSGTVTIDSKSVALVVGVTWGDGKLSYAGKTYPFTVKGLSVVDLGVSKVSARGKVYHLQKVEDFSGTYAAAQAGAAVGGGMSVVALKNQNGVVMELSSTQTGVKLTLAGEGIEIKLK